VKDHETVTSPDLDQAERTFERIIGNSAALESVLDQVEQVAPTDSIHGFGSIICFTALSDIGLLRR
jgi:transcriptional regulator with GAF, ATPase, and Fis domain